ncbi:uncharacterized protein DNG_08077 [Cephalotrichum gorgonifer]|uniref:Uncharacterized protein n=1 Tax=Cephalotrichum gorgonifer TaxID=2041049 RepID=A0AAE8N326_9PEZI|nr:uncharacterized protein DNG_08077 [Cephalotrichum gorgonifer]
MSLPKRTLTALFLAFTTRVLALPQAITAPSPSISGCSFHEDHWDCPTPCSTIESVQYGIDTTVSNYPGFVSSLNKLYSTSGVTPSGSRIPVFTTTVPLSDGETMTAYGFYYSAVLEEAGYLLMVITGIVSHRRRHRKTQGRRRLVHLMVTTGTAPRVFPSPQAAPLLLPRRRGRVSVSLMATIGTAPQAFPSRQPPLLLRPQDRASVSLTATIGIALLASQSLLLLLLQKRRVRASVNLMVTIGTAPPVFPSPQAALPLPPRLRDRASVSLMVTIGTVPPVSQSLPLLPRGRNPLRREGWASASLMAIIGIALLVSQSLLPLLLKVLARLLVTMPTTPPPSEPNPTDTDNMGECTPHGDHWHCPPGVPEPTSPAGSSSTGSYGGNGNTSDEGECTLHDDHWDCPPGVPEPTSPPVVAGAGREKPGLSLQGLTMFGLAVAAALAFSQ